MTDSLPPEQDIAAEVLAAARAALDQAHAADPTGKELAYADQVEAVFALWFGRDLSPAEQLAARCQHLERWVIARDDYPRDKPGYFRWRKAVHARQGDRAREILTATGVPTAIVDRIATATAKRAVKDEWTMAMEDAACLVFLQRQAEAFASDNDYDAAKMIDIIRKTWRKVSPRGRELAGQLPLPAAVQALVAEALAPESGA